MLLVSAILCSFKPKEDQMCVKVICPQCDLGEIRRVPGNGKVKYECPVCGFTSNHPFYDIITKGKKP
jgi:transposase-like protein